MANWDKTFFHKSKISELMGWPECRMVVIEKQHQVSIKVGKFFNRNGIQPVFARGNNPRSKMNDETEAIKAINKMFPEREVPNSASEGTVQPYSLGGQFNIPPLNLVRDRYYQAQICSSFEDFDDFLAIEKSVERDTALEAVLGAHAPIVGGFAKDEGFALIKAKGKLHRVMIIEPFTDGTRRVIGVDRGVITTKSKGEIFNLPAGAAATSSALMRCRVKVRDLPGYNDRWIPHFIEMIRAGIEFSIQPLAKGHYYNITNVKIFIVTPFLPGTDLGHHLAIATAGPAPEPHRIEPAPVDHILDVVIKYLSGE